MCNTVVLQKSDPDTRTCVDTLKFTTLILLNLILPEKKLKQKLKKNELAKQRASSGDVINKPDMDVNTFRPTGMLFC